MGYQCSHKWLVICSIHVLGVGRSGDAATHILQEFTCIHGAGESVARRRPEKILKSDLFLSQTNDSMTRLEHIWTYYIYRNLQKYSEILWSSSPEVTRGHQTGHPLPKVTNVLPQVVPSRLRQPGGSTRTARRAPVDEDAEASSNVGGMVTYGDLQPGLTNIDGFSSWDRSKSNERMKHSNLVDHPLWGHNFTLPTWILCNSLKIAVIH